MSADNWGVCPRCYKKHKEKIQQKQEEFDEQYGRVSQEDYIQMNNFLTNLIRSGVPDNLREDYEVGLEKDGEFSIGHWCQCSDCGFHFSFRHEEQVQL